MLHSWIPHQASTPHYLELGSHILSLFQKILVYTSVRTGMWANMKFKDIFI